MLLTAFVCRDTFAEYYEATKKPHRCLWWLTTKKRKNNDKDAVCKQTQCIINNAGLLTSITQ